MLVAKLTIMAFTNVVLLICCMLHLVVSTSPSICAIIAATNVEAETLDWTCDNSADPCDERWTGIECDENDEIQSIVLNNLELNGLFI